MCKHCHEGLAECFICKKFGPAEDEVPMNPVEQQEQRWLKMEEKERKGGGDIDVGYQNDQTFTAVQQCIVGPCHKYFHVECLKKNYSVEFYYNNRNKMRFRCPLHYCIGCSISGNSVQILQCAACPTCYHLKCFRADRQAIKITRKFILCGKHVDLIEKFKKLHKKVHPKAISGLLNSREESGRKMTLQQR
mmetsp:Transcript_36643/g.48112  ORF Transcript_36643/g.48112 Transcript_36643/m.48112 type:complete len:191 (-) Transcript_36643:402-974(-)